MAVTCVRATRAMLDGEPVKIYAGDVVPDALQQCALDEGWGVDRPDDPVRQPGGGDAPQNGADPSAPVTADADASGSADVDIDVEADADSLTGGGL